ncbi:MAG: SDR family oxidoreductase [Dehalococcoidia bacterium]
MRAAGHDVEPVFADVSVMPTGELLVQRALDRWGRLDISVCCAGILRDRMIFNMTEEEWDAVIATHLSGHLSA